MSGELDILLRMGVGGLMVGALGLKYGPSGG